ncbi:MAG: hemolysin family protein [Lentisphaeria bacterium]|nr:hemolysin family protein [Lentisphaeria bacterium]
MMTVVGYILLLLLIALAAFYSGTETAMTSVNPSWIHEQAKKGNGSAKIAGYFLKDSSRLLGTVLIGNNIVHVCMTNLAKLIIGTIILRYAASGIDQNSTSWDEWLTSIILTPTVLIFGEALPKAIGRNHAAKVTLWAARPLRVTEILLTPALWATDWITRLLTPAQYEQDLLKNQATLAREDIKTIAEMAAEQGIVKREAGEMLQSVLELDQRPVETAMVPLIEIRSLPESATIGDALALTGESGYRQIPIYQERVDHIVGMVKCRSLLSHYTNGTNVHEFLNSPLKPMIDRNLLFVPESQPVSATLEALRQRSVNIAIVVDEYGGRTGMVTIDDLVEVIVGNLNDERDEEFSNVQKISDNAFICNGRMEIRILEEHLGIDIPNTGFETAAGMVLKLAGHIPSNGEKILFRQFEITVLEVVDNRIGKLKFQNTRKIG